MRFVIYLSPYGAEFQCPRQGDSSDSRAWMCLVSSTAPAAGRHVRWQSVARLRSLAPPSHFKDLVIPLTVVRMLIVLSILTAIYTTLKLTLVGARSCMCSFNVHLLLRLPSFLRQRTLRTSIVFQLCQTISLYSWPHLLSRNIHQSRWRKRRHQENGARESVVSINGIISTVYTK